jgi:hypothetical protein
LTEICLDERRRSAVAFDAINEQSPFALPPSGDDYLSTWSATRLAAAPLMPLLPPVMSATFPAKFQVTSHALA